MIKGADGRPVFHLRGPPTKSRTGRKVRSDTGGKHEDSEHQFQVEVAAALVWALPDDYLWTANAAGVRVSMHVATKMKAAGVRRGWPDMQILFPSAVTRFIELKADGSLSVEQKAFRDRCLATGRDIWATARTLIEVESALLRWKVPLRMPLSYANRYQAPMWERMSADEKRRAWAAPE